MTQKNRRPQNGPAPGFTRVTEYEVDPRAIFGATPAERHRHRKPLMVKHHDTKLSWIMLDVHDPKLYDSPILQDALRDVLVGLDAIGLMLCCERKRGQSLAAYVKQLVQVIDRTSSFSVSAAQSPEDI